MVSARRALALVLASADDRTAAMLMQRQRGRALPWDWIWLTPRSLMQARWEQRVGAADLGWGLTWSTDEAPRDATDRITTGVDSRSIIWAWNRLGAAWDAETGDPGYSPDDIAYAQSERQAQWVAALRALGGRVANAAGTGEGLGMHPHPLHWLAAGVACGLECADFVIRTGQGQRLTPALSRVAGIADGLDASDAPGWFQQRSGPAQRAWVFGTRYSGPGDEEFACRCAAFVTSLGWACATLELRPSANGGLRLAGVDPCPLVDDAAVITLCEEWMHAEAAAGAAAVSAQ